jgi:hypothetical protein
MRGNEILVNLENHEYFAINELLGGFYELGKRKPPKRIDLMINPIVAKAMSHLKDEIYGHTFKQLAQVPIILHNLN